MAGIPTKTASLSPAGLRVLLLLMLLPAGGFSEWSACLAALFLLLWLLWAMKKAGALRLPQSPAFFAALLMELLFLLSPLWAADRGMAPFGFVKFLPLPLFLLALEQLDAAGRRSLWDDLPWAGAAMALLSFLLSRVPALAPWFLVNGRLAGFFQYPNSFALYLLLGLALLLFGAPVPFPLPEKAGRPLRLVCLLILAAGILLSGSRTVFLLLLAVVLFSAWRQQDRRLRFGVPGLGLLALLALGIWAAATGRQQGAGRFLTISLSASTFLGRLLYARDALPLILGHPLGLGYLGYPLLQGSVQTGVYSVTHLHNEPLQLLLDVGWLPGIAFLLALVRGFGKQNSPRNRGMLLLLLGHSLLDFDFQFTSLALLLMLALDPGGEKSRRIGARGPVRAAAALLGAVCLFFGAASAFHALGRESAAVALYPGHTRARLALLEQAQTAEDMEAQARQILRLSDSVSLAHSAMARAAFSRGDFAAVIEEKQAALRLSRYSLTEYLDYLDMLNVGVALYRQAGQAESAERLRQEMLAVPEALRQVEEGTSALGRRIADQPELTLPEAYRAMIERERELAVNS